MSKENRKESGKGKGLGWIPEYPDLRDYSILNEEKLRFKVDKNTDFFEIIISALIKAGIQNDAPQINELENAILGNIRFIKVKVHKFFRDSKTEKNETESKITLINIESELRKQQILELKKCLILLAMNRYFSVEEEWNSKLGINLEEPKEIIEFMNRYEYDKYTQELVKTFQNCSNIKADGIFGLETYTTLNEYLFNNSEKKLNPFSISCSTSKTKHLSRIKFVSVTSLIPKEGMEEIFNFLMLKAQKQIIKEYEQWKGLFINLKK